MLMRLRVMLDWRRMDLKQLRTLLAHRSHSLWIICNLLQMVVVTLLTRLKEMMHHNGSCMTKDMEAKGGGGGGGGSFAAASE